MAQLADDFPLEVQWKSFELRPEGVKLPPKPNDYMEAVKSSFERLGAVEGLAVRLNSHQSSSRLALEGAKYAESKGRFDDYHSRVFKAQFVEDRDIGNLDILVDIAREAGLDEAEFRTCLSERKMKPAVDAELAVAARLGITGIPTFIFNGGAEVIVGAQPLKNFHRALERILD